MKRKDEIIPDIFFKADIRVGTILDVYEFPEARKPAYKLKIDFGPEIGIKQTSAQITNYRKDDLKGRKVIAVVNFPVKRVANFNSEVLVLGAVTDEGVKLLSVDTPESIKDGTVIA
ncbi:MAG: tRNA-binding protein [Thermoplasmata archaeon]